MAKKPRLKKTPQDARGPRGEGSFTERKDGRWQYAAPIVRDDGTRGRRFVYAKSLKELQRRVMDERVGTGAVVRSDPGSVAQLVEGWLAGAKPNLAPTTFAMYESIWRKHAAPRIGKLKVGELDASAVAKMYAEMRADGQTSVIINRTAVVMQRAVNVAKRQGTFSKENPFCLVEKPRVRAKVQRYATAAEVRRFLDAAKGDRYYGLWVLLATSGLRLGEAIGLQWKDIDLKKRVIAVQRAIVEVNGFAVEGSTKTRGSRRSVDLGQLAVDALRERELVAKTEPRSPLVFPTTVGTPVRRSNLRRSHFIPLLKAAKLDGITIHGLRHAMASIALAEGVTSKVVSERLGHSTVRMTLDRYSHSLPTLQRDAAKAIDSAIGRGSKALERGARMSDKMSLTGKQGNRARRKPL